MNEKEERKEQGRRGKSRLLEAGPGGVFSEKRVACCSLAVAEVLLQSRIDVADREVSIAVRQRHFIGFRHIPSCRLASW